jgi:hypothetical protein
MRAPAQQETAHVCCSLPLCGANASRLSRMPADAAPLRSGSLIFSASDAVFPPPIPPSTISPLLSRRHSFPPPSRRLSAAFAHATPPTTPRLCGGATQKDRRQECNQACAAQRRYARSAGERCAAVAQERTLQKGGRSAAYGCCAMALMLPSCCRTRDIFADAARRPTRRRDSPRLRDAATRMPARC